MKTSVTRFTYMGLFMVTLATLMFEILLTRIFSVTTYYHFAFMAISIALFGMTLGALIVYLFPAVFTLENAKSRMVTSSLLFSITMIFAFLTHLCIPLGYFQSIVGIYSIVFTYLIISIPFVMSGIAVCLALTKFPKQIGKLYAADLAGAALGCILLLFLLNATDGPTAVVVVACLASLGALFFAIDLGHKKSIRWSLFITVCLGLFSLIHTHFVHNQKSMLKPIWVKGAFEPRPLYEKWNSFSRITVFPVKDDRELPTAWGLSPNYKSGKIPRELYLKIDAAAGTPLTEFNGDLSTLDYLKYDITNLVHYIRTQSNVLVIGSGGGRDILSALFFDQKKITAVEINREINRTVNDVYGDFTGHLDRNPKVDFVYDDARSYIARQTEKFDIIQASLIDTWAATSAGAFVLTEHSLYTLEAWTSFLDHLTPKGVITVSRWYKPVDFPKEIYRTISLASATLIKSGVENPKDHIILARSVEEEIGGIGTLIVSKSPFTKEDTATIHRVCDDLGFDVVVSPKFSLNETFTALVSGQDPRTILKDFPVDVSPPTDDKPFFFYMMGLKDIWKIKSLRGNVPVFVLGVLLVTVLGLTALCIIGPLMTLADRSALKGTSPLFTFFACIGLGFIMIEISQMQRLIIFLGHPIYGLSVVLFTVLLSSSLGSFTCQKIKVSELQRSGSFRFAFLLLSLFLFGILTPRIIHHFSASITPVRILLSVICLAPIGFFMGMPFPLGMKRALVRSESLLPWLWGINGATSVCASVITIAIALTFGISAAFWCGVSCYVLAFFAFRTALR